MKTLEQKILQILDNNSGKCLDTAEERQEVADALFKVIFPHDN